MRTRTTNEAVSREVRIDRRRALLGGLTILGGVGISARTARASALSRASGLLRGIEDQRTLVLIQLSGGNDGLSTVVPFGDDAYGRARSKTRIGEREVLRVDDYRGLHPKLRATRALFESGRLAIVEGVGYAGPARSHFKSMDVWHAASENGRGAGEGWVGRLASVAWPASDVPELVVHIGGKTPYSLYSTAHRPVAFEVPEGYRWFGDVEESKAYAEYARSSEGGSGSVLDRLRSALRDAQNSSGRVRRAVASYQTRVEYPADEFGSGLRVIAALLEARLGARVLSIELDGFDTHNSQKGTHDRLMGTLDAGLSAFLRDLRGREIEKDTLVVAFSEFGRRVQENGSLGTDHGKAAPMFVAGAAVRGGFYGRHPSLVDLDEGDLVFSTDFRSVYATVIEDWFGASHAEVLGAEYPRLPLVRKS